MSDLRALAKAHSEASNNPVAAVEALRAEVLSMMRGRQPQAVIDAINEGCGAAIYAVRHASRARTKHRFLPGNANQPSSVLAAMSNVIGESILDRWIMDDGRRLGDVRGTELPAFAARARAQAKGSLVNAALYDRLTVIAGDRFVREAVKPRRAEREFQAAWSEQQQAATPPPRSRRQAAATRGGTSAA